MGTESGPESFLLADVMSCHAALKHSSRRETKEGATHDSAHEACAAQREGHSCNIMT